jgi:RimJ/RimL family protein N-acetyltransferase
MAAIIRTLLPRRFEWVLYRTAQLPPPDVSDLTIEVVEPRQALTPPQHAYLARRVRRLSLWYLLRWRRQGQGWLFLVRSADRYCHYTFVTPGHRYRRLFPIITEPRALLIGPCLTEAELRGRAIYPRVLQHVVATLAECGYGPFYIDTSLDNVASIRGMEKAGFKRCGVWRGRRALGNLLVCSRRVAD